jgi:TetR/AcrR family transcriptional regulator
MVLNTETEQKIMASAEKLFYMKGKAGTSMQDIASDAGINRTLLNYYFRSKDQLFESVFRRALSRFVPGLAAMLHSDMSFDEYVPRMIHTVIDAMLENPQIPIFVLQELSSNPARMHQIIREMGIDPVHAIKKMETEKVIGKGETVDPRQAIINLLSLCIFPFAARPMVTQIFYQGDDEAYIAAMRERKEILPGLFRQIMVQKERS